MKMKEDKSGTKRVLRRQSVQTKTDEPEPMDTLDDSTSTSIVDDCSRSDTSTTSVKRQRHSKGSSSTSSYSKMIFKCTNIIKEDHGSPLFCVQFHPRTRSDQLVFATVGSNRATVYECSAWAPYSFKSGSSNTMNSSKKTSADSLESSFGSQTSELSESQDKDDSLLKSSVANSSKSAGRSSEQEGQAATESGSKPSGGSDTGSGVRGSDTATRPGSVRLLQCYMDPDSEENLYTCAWSFNKENSHSILAVAGARGIVRVIDVATGQCVKNLVGHGQAINDVKIHPRDSSLLLSVSKDHAMRLWNLMTGVCVAMFGGVEGHRDEVLSAVSNILPSLNSFNPNYALGRRAHSDIDSQGRHLVSCGMDHSIKVWRLDKPALESAIALSYTYNPSKAGERSFKTFSQHYPDFSTRDVHSNYVDCVQWYGRFIVSKSCENEVVCWKPGKLGDTNIGTPIKATGSTANSGNEASDNAGSEGSSEISSSVASSQPSTSDSQNVTILHKFDVKDCDIWFLKFCMDYRRKYDVKLLPSCRDDVKLLIASGRTSGIKNSPHSQHVYNLFMDMLGETLLSPFTGKMLLALGNQMGKVYVWDIDTDDWTQARPTILSHAKCTSAVRQTCFNRDGTILLCVCDDSTIWRWDRQ